MSIFKIMIVAIPNSKTVVALKMRLIFGELWGKHHAWHVLK
jgi:hypothetical protein